MIETSELGGRLALVDPKSLETEQRSLYDFIDQKFVPWSREANFAIKMMRALRRAFQYFPLHAKSE